MRHKLYVKVIAIALMQLIGSGVYAESIDGAKILEQEASRARELQKLEYQAKLLEQRARVAKAYQELKQSGGAVPGDFSGMYGLQEQTAAQPSSSAVPIAATAPSYAVPTAVPKLKKMMGKSALFETASGQVVAHVGMLLPGGYKLLSLNVASGAQLEKNGMIYLAAIGW
ncbi:hypothetical protein A9Q99_13855 [Gammaproteobacteria bacterium 45_16_T64]|nr:hypothetical protein A9Q99_13855 [Gammaproteobacteria bacterium 45_16_T64]